MQRVDTNSHASRQLLELHRGLTMCRQRPEHMGSAHVAGYGDFSEVLLYGRLHGIAAALVSISKALQVARQASVPDELSQSCLLQPRRTVVNQSLERCRSPQEITRNNHIAQSQSGTERAREGVKVDDAPVAIQ